MSKDNTPRHIKAKFASKCKSCGTGIPKGIYVYYYPSEKKIACLSCGHIDFQSAMEAEADAQMFEAQNAGFFQNFR